MPKSPQELFQYLDSLSIKHKTIYHPPVFTAQDSIDWKDNIPGLHCKNLFVYNKEKQYFLITMPAFEKADLNSIAKQLNSSRFSFAKADKMLEILGVPAGHATPFAMINESAKNVIMLIDESIPEAEAINVHPLTNEASTILSGQNLMKFLDSLCLKSRIIRTT